MRVPRRNATALTAGAVLAGDPVCTGLAVAASVAAVTAGASLAWLTRWDKGWAHVCQLDKFACTPLDKGKARCSRKHGKPQVFRLTLSTPQTPVSVRASRAAVRAGRDGSRGRDESGADEEHW